MRLMLALAVVLFVTASAWAKTTSDISYSDAGGSTNATSLDIYSPDSGHDHPVVVWIHGGGWRIGDKSHVHQKPQAFNDQGFVLVSINYRLHPDGSYKEQVGDVAGAIRWVHQHIHDYGGSPEKIYLMGHSAGAHLAALVATDERYLKSAGLNLDAIHGVVLLDGAGYNIPIQANAAQPRLRELYRTIFGDDPAKQKDASPINHVGKGKGIPPFLILHVADRRDSKLQAEGFADKLNEAGVEATVVPAEGKTHMTINRELGQPDDKPTEAVFEFLKRQAD